MPAEQTNSLEAGAVWTKEYNGTTYMVRVLGEDRFKVEGGGREYTAASITAIARFIMQGEWTSRVVARQFLNLPAYNGPSRPRRTRTVTQPDGSTQEIEVEIKGKCSYEGCYEPADCKHGFCHLHCHRHSVGSYSGHGRPRNDKVHVGVEMEVEYPDSHHYGRGAALDNGHHDGSLGCYGVEYKMIANTDEVVGKAMNLAETVWKRRARVSRSCGLHVHLDVRQISSSQVEKWLAWMERTQDTWFSLVPPSRRSNNYVNPIVSGVYGNTTSHYTWAHKTGYNTVEIRIHGGTLNPYKIAGWLVALIHLRTKAGTAGFEFPDTGDAEADFWAVFADCKKEGLEYLKARKATGGQLRDVGYGAVEE